MWDTVVAEEWAGTLVKVPVSHWSHCAALWRQCSAGFWLHMKWMKKKPPKTLQGIFSIGRTRKKYGFVLFWMKVWNLQTFPCKLIGFFNVTKSPTQWKMFTLFLIFPFSSSTFLYAITEKGLKGKQTIILKRVKCSSREHFWTKGYEHFHFWTFDMLSSPLHNFCVLQGNPFAPGVKCFNY